MPGALGGIRVVDTTTMISGPICTRILADQGADVIKVEAPGVGDLVRVMGARRDGLSATFVTSNRNKRSVVIDLKQKEGLVLLEKLVATADVFVQNFRPGAAERMGIGEEALRRIKPDLVYCSINGFGEKGPYAHKKVYDPVVQALSGLAAIQADRDTGRPRMVRLIVPDKLTALTAAQAITAALFHRERTGEGQHIRLAMLDTMVAFAWPEGMAGHTFIGEGQRDRRARYAQDLIFETSDGYLTAGAVSDSEWRGLCRAIEHEEWLDDPRFQTAAGRIMHAGERLLMTAEVFRARTTAEWLERLEAEDVPSAPVLSRKELLSHPQIEANELIIESNHPVAGPMRQPRPPERFSATPSSLRLPAPSLGEHTSEVFAELGLAEDELATLRERAVVA